MKDALEGLSQIEDHRSLKRIERDIDQRLRKHLYVRKRKKNGLLAMPHFWVIAFTFILLLLIWMAWWVLSKSVLA